MAKRDDNGTAACAKGTRKIGRFDRPVRAILVVTLQALLGVSVVDATDSASTAADVVEPHTPVRSDGVSLSFPETPSVTGESAFEGLDREVPSTLESAEEAWSLLELPPAKPPVGTNVIIGPDDRVLVSPTTTFPARAVALVTFSGGRCTGWLYGRDIVATAGHCVHTGGSSGNWRSGFRVYPGRNGGLSPYGYCTAKTLYSVVGWTENSDEQYDYGAIKLNCTIGDTTGWFGYFWQSASLTGDPETINGYPGDKPLTQWKDSGNIGATKTRQVFYLNDTYDGMSGSPVYTTTSDFCDGYCSMGIHAYGTHGIWWPHSAFNHATRITESVFDNLYNWKYSE